MNSRTSYLGRDLVACLALTLLSVAAADAAPRFIAESKVETGAVYSEVTLRFRCNVHYVSHDPTSRGDILIIRLEPTSVCTGAPPTVALSRELHRPPGADDARLDTVEYDGASPGSEMLRVSFQEAVRFDVRAPGVGDTLTIRVFPPVDTSAAAATPEPGIEGRVSQRVISEPETDTRYVINLESSRRRPATADLPSIELPAGASLLVSEVLIDGQQWYRIQVGHFETAEEAARAMRDLRRTHPSAWIALAGESEEALAPLPSVSADTNMAAAGTAAASNDAEQLMREARRAMTAGELSRAVQIYTKVLQIPGNDYQQDAQEYLALARERNGQLAHARAEYERYLAVYPDTAGAERVRQRLNALLATGRRPDVTPGAPATTAQRSAAREASPWSLRTFVSQYYRRDVNQVNDQDEVVNQSSVYTDASLDARRRGERFDIAARITAGYRNDLLGEDDRRRSDNDLRVSYAYVDLVDARTRLRGRLGRQTRSTGGVLGRFDGLNLGYDVTETLRIEAVAGRPVYSTSEDFTDSRLFQGISTTYAPFGKALDLGVFVLQQQVEGLTDRSAVGAEFRYFGERRSAWGMLSYDTEFAEMGNMFLQGSWRSQGNLTLTGQVDVRRSPFLSLGNALVGQQVDSFEDLMVLFTEEELRQFALDRSPEVTTVSAGVSRPLSPKVQFNLNASHSTIEATPESGAVPATEQSEYSYYSADLVASSLFKEGDVAIVGLRYSVSDTTDVYSINLDTRFPVGRTWRINPRLRVDYREINSDQSTQWTYSPSLRMQLRVGRKWRIEFEAGKQFSVRDMDVTELDRESNFVHLGYQLFF